MHALTLTHVHANYTWGNVQVDEKAKTKEDRDMLLMWDTMGYN